MKRLLLAAVFAAMMLVPSSSASAALTGEYARFSQCPLALPNSVVELCLYAETTGGSFTMGSKTVPLKNPVVLQGGLGGTNGNIFQPFTMAAATDGNTLSKAAQPVPGGLLGVTAPTWWPLILQNLFNETINNGFTGVTATVELAGPASGVKFNLFSALTGEGPAFVLPVKVKLSNPFLGNNCYIGSSSSPINLNLTTGTTAPPAPNEPISGNSGEFVEPAFGIGGFKNNRLVDNAFAAPGANGCGGLFSFLVDPFVNSIVGVPSAAGTNTAILEGTTYFGNGEILREQ